MNCSKCGSQLNPGEMFCPVCGTPVNNANNMQQQYGNNQPVQQSMYGPNQQQPVGNINNRYGPSVPPQPIYGPNVPSQPMYVQPVQQPIPQTNSTSRTILFVTIALSIVACFLPIISISVKGYTFSFNYVYIEGKIADGAIIVGAQIAAIICLVLNKKVPVIVMQIISCVILSIFTIKLTSTFGEIAILAPNMFDLLGIGFYVLAISLIASLILSIKLPK